jgi:hypothetical protein
LIFFAGRLIVVAMNDKFGYLGLGCDVGLKVEVSQRSGNSKQSLDTRNYLAYMSKPKSDT